MPEHEIKIQATNSQIECGVLFVEQTLKNLGYSGKTLISAVLSCEEIMVQMMLNAERQDSMISIAITGNIKKAKVKISCKGQKISFNNTSTLSQVADLSDIEDEQAAIISRMILNSYPGNISLKYSHGVNIAEVKLEEKKHSYNPVIVCIFLGASIGFLLRMLLPQSAEIFIDTNIFSVIFTLFMNAIKMIVCPLVFFSIAEAMTGFSDYSTFGRISGKIIGLYLFTTSVAITIAFGVSVLLHPGDTSLAPAVLEIIGKATSPTTVADVSIRNTIISIVPTNFLGAFINANILQVLFVGIITGIASGLLGEKSNAVQEFIKTGNLLFSKITMMIIKTMPLAVFCIVANLTLTTGIESLISLIHVFATCIIGIFSLCIFYILFLTIAGKLNPFKFLSKYKEAIIMAFTTCSSNATMPVSMKSLDNLGVSKKIYAFSIPLGATINMDGTSVCYIIITMFMARIFDIRLSGSMIVLLFLSVMLLSIGTPPIPGAGIACLAMLFSQVGVAPEAVSYIIIICTFGDFFTTASNVISDAVVTTIVAHSEGLLNMEKYNA